MNRVRIRAGPTERGPLALRAWTPDHRDLQRPPGDAVPGQRESEQFLALDETTLLRRQISSQAAQSTPLLRTAGANERPAARFERRRCLSPMMRLP